MKRRDFMILGAAIIGVPGAAFAAPVDYFDGLVKTRLAAGETVFLDFKASWCGTCKAQERVIKTLKAANPEYEAKITFINVDWDDFGRSDLVKRMNIPRRSTLVALRGERELGRIVADTSKASIKDLMDRALAAGS